MSFLQLADIPSSLSLSKRRWMRMEALKNVQQLVRSSISGWESMENTNSSLDITSLTINLLPFPDDSRGANAVRAACKEVGSVSNIIFEMRFNSDVFSPGVLRKTK